MGHVVLLGDSVFDNGVYVPGEPDVRAQLTEKMPDGWKVSLLAEDGAVSASVETQLLGQPEDATHLVISAGGNDALSRMEFFREPVGLVADALTRMGEIRSQFHHSYRSMLKAVLSQRLPTVTCTIYNPRLEDPAIQFQATAALPIFNDIIISMAIANRLPLIDLRRVCSEPGDLANPIEPSVQGGDKITDVIKKILLNYDFSNEHAIVYC